MRDGWRRVKFGEATRSLDSKRVPVKTSDRQPGPYPYWGASGVVDHVDGYLFDHPTLLVSEDGENLKTRKTPIAFLARGKYWVNNHAHVAIAADGYDLRFLYYAMSIADVSGYLTGSTQPKLTATSLATVAIEAPGLAEQRRIAAVLGAFDDLIDTNQRLAEAAEGLAVAVASHTATEVRLGDIASVPPLKTEAPDGTVDHFSLPAFDSGRRPEAAAGRRIKSNKIRLHDHTVLVSRLNPHIPRVWMAYPSERPAFASTEFVPIIAKDGCTTEQIWAVCAAPKFTAQMREHVTGTTGSHQRVDKKALASIAVPDVRSLNQGQRDAITKLVKEANACRDASDRLRRTRDELLPLLMSGAVSPGDVEVAA